MGTEASLNQDLQAILTIIKWVVGILTPIVTVMAWAIYKQWMHNNQIVKDNAEALKKLVDDHATEMKDVWQTTLAAFVESGKVIERLTAKVGGATDARSRKRDGA